MLEREEILTPTVIPSKYPQKRLLSTKRNQTVIQGTAKYKDFKK